MKSDTKKYFYILIVWILLSNVSYGQEEMFYYADNIFHEIYKKNKVKSCTAIDKQYKNGEQIESYTSNKSFFDKQGNLILEIDSYGANSSCNDSLLYEYDREQRHKKFTWLSKCPSQVEITEYKYNNLGQLIEYCDSSNKKHQMSVELDSCVIINYSNGEMLSEISSTGEVLHTFSYINGKVLVKTKNGELKSVYENENHIESHYSNGIYYRKFNILHQLINVEKHDNQGNLIQITKYKYQNSLLTDTVTYNNKNKIVSSTKFEYNYFE